MLKILLFLSIFLLIEAKNFKNSVEFSVKPFKNGQKFEKIEIFNENFENIGKFVKFAGNSTKIQGKVNFPEDFKKIVLKLENSNGNYIGQDEVLVSLRKNGSHMTIHSDDYKMKITTQKSIFQQVLNKQIKNTGCDCVHGNCACCLDVQIPEFRHSVCVNATYNPVTIGLDLSIGVDGHYFSEEISIRNPPPICFSLPIPGAEHIAGVCVAFEDLDLDKKAKILSGCVEFEVELIHLRMLHFKVGCFRMPI